VAEELEKYCFPVLLDSKEHLVLCPETAEWLDRLENYFDQVSVKP
jgi:hypothetical protein